MKKHPEGDSMNKLNETGFVSSIKKTLNGRDIDELDEFHHKIMLANTPTKKQRLIDEVQSSIQTTEKHITNPKFTSSEVSSLKSHLTELNIVLSKAKNIHFDYQPLDNNYQESVMTEDMSSGLTPVSAATVYVRNYNMPVSNQTVANYNTVAKPPVSMGSPHEPELPLDSLTGKVIKSVKQAAEDNALDKVAVSLSQRASKVNTDTEKDELQKEVRDKMIEAENLIRSATSFTNSERPKLLSNLHTFIDKLRTTDEKLSVSQPDATRKTITENVLVEAMFGKRKYNLYKKEFATTELHDVVGGMALEGGLEVQKVVWYNKFNKISTAAEADVFVNDAQKCIDILGTVHQEVTEVDRPTNNSEKADATQRDEIREKTLNQIRYMSGLVEEAKKKRLELS
jgi:hypothetical protein